MSTASTEPPERRRSLRGLAVPVAAAVVIGAVGGGGAYYAFAVRRPKPHRSNPIAARRVAVNHALVALEGLSEQSVAVAVIGRTSSGPKILTVPASTVVQVPGVGPRSVALALRQSGTEATAVAVANELRITVPFAMSAVTANVAGTVDALGGVTVDVPRAVTDRAGGETFAAGPTQMPGDEFVRYMTGAFRAETDRELQARQQSGWRALLALFVQPSAAQAFRTWTTDVPLTAAVSLLRSCASSSQLIVLPLTPVPVSGGQVANVDEGALPPIRRELGDFTNGAETLDGRRVRLVVGTSAPAAMVVGRILVNAGYVIEISGREVRPASITRISVAPTVTDAEATGDDLADLLGMGFVKVSTDTDTDADIILTVGMDWAQANGLPTR
jgi:hypothetical protein